MNAVLTFLLASSLVVTADFQQASQARPKSRQLVHFVVINMSGRTREAHHRSDVIPLPVAKRVSLQVPSGDSIEISSPTEKRVEDAIAISARDEGRVIPIQ